MTSGVHPIDTFFSTILLTYTVLQPNLDWDLIVPDWGGANVYK